MRCDVTDSKTGLGSVVGTYVRPLDVEFWTTTCFSRQKFFFVEPLMAPLDAALSAGFKTSLGLIVGPVDAEF